MTPTGVRMPVPAPGEAFVEHEHLVGFPMPLPNNFKPLPSRFLAGIYRDDEPDGVYGKAVFVTVGQRGGCGHLARIEGLIAEDTAPPMAA